MEKISPVVNLLINQGVPLETVVLILMFPIIATLIVFLRQVLGIKAFGIYTPLIITFAFLATHDLRYGIAIFISVILVGMLARLLLKSLRLLYLPRVAIMLSVVAAAMLILLAFGGSLRRTGLAAVSIFPILIMITLVEKFIAIQIEKGDKTAVVLAIETLLISIIGYFVASWHLLIQLLVCYPWLVLFTLPINIILGKWTGLRISEYFRFKEIMKKM